MKEVAGEGYRRQWRRPTKERIWFRDGFGLRSDGSLEQELDGGEDLGCGLYGGLFCECNADTRGSIKIDTPHKFSLGIFYQFLFIYTSILCPCSHGFDLVTLKIKLYCIFFSLDYYSFKCK